MNGMVCRKKVIMPGITAARTRRTLNLSGPQNETVGKEMPEADSRLTRFH